MKKRNISLLFEAAVLCLFFGFMGCSSAPKATESPVLSIDQALKEATQNIESRLQEGTKIAALTFSSPSEGLSEYVLEELSVYLVNGGKLVVVTRNDLDSIRAELDFNLSDEVGDKSAQEAGRLLGAQYIITGSLLDMGDVSRIRLNTILVESGSIAASYSEDIVNDRKLARLMTSGAAGQSTPTLVQGRQSGNGPTQLEAAGTGVQSGNGPLQPQTTGGSSTDTIKAVAVPPAQRQEPAENMSQDEQRIRALVESTLMSDTKNTYNDIQRRQAWINLMTECENYFKEHLPYEIIYDPASLKTGTINYQRNTTSLSFDVAIKPTSQWQIVNKTLEGFIATGKGGEWQIVDWPIKPVINRNQSIATYYGIYRIAYAIIPSIFAKENTPEHPISIEAELLDDIGNTIARGKADFLPRLGFPSLFESVWDDSFVFTLPFHGTFTFVNVNTDEITNVLGLRILRIDGFASDSGYAKVTAGDTQVDMRPSTRELDSYQSRIPANRQRDYRNQWEARRRIPR